MRTIGRLRTLSGPGARLCCADEPFGESFGSIVLRHVNVGLARGYLHELKVKSRQGIETAAKQGRHAEASRCTGIGSPSITTRTRTRRSRD